VKPSGQFPASGEQDGGTFAADLINNDNRSH
jgi:hypothetical protein